MHVQRASTKPSGCGQESLCITVAPAGTTAARIPRRHSGGMEGSGAAHHPEQVFPCSI